MKKILIFATVLFLYGCKQNSSNTDKGGEEMKDPHSFANPAQAVVKHLDLNITVDFNTQQISGKASWTVTNLTGTDNIIFDTRDMQIQKVTRDKDEKETKYALGEGQDYLGQSLTVDIDTGTSVVNIYYTTSKNAAAVQWLSPQQTAGKKKPFLFTQSQPILARTWIPCQDGPGVRFTYNAIVNAPKDLMAVMSGENPQKKNETGTYHFKQTHPIPSYLLALAVGDIEFKSIDERTGVYAEPSILDKAAWEFADMGEMVKVAEDLYGPYRWGRYDVLVLPPSFPYGGMENPNLTFATPTVIAGDRSLVSLIAHELAHSWSGNLVTNATWNDIWLNEGFTTYFERRIIEAVYGREEALMQEVLARQTLNETVKEIGDTSADTRLKLELTGRDPDVGLSDIAYEKGSAFLRTIEQAVGRPKFDSFLNSYFNKYAFQSRTTEQFLDYMNENLASTVNSFDDKVKVKQWVYNAGVPDNIPPVSSKNFRMIDSAVKKWKGDKQAAGLSKSIKSTNELLYFISQLPEKMTVEEMSAIDKEFRFTESGNAEVQTSWYTLAIRNNYARASPSIEKFLTEVGRRKFLRPLYKEMIKTPEGKEWARKIYIKARQNYHPVAYTTVDELLK